MSAARPFRPRLVAGSTSAPPPAPIDDGCDRVALARRADVLDALTARLTEVCARVGHVPPAVVVAPSMRVPRSPLGGCAIADQARPAP